MRSCGRRNDSGEISIGGKVLFREVALGSGNSGGMRERRRVRRNRKVDTLCLFILLWNPFATSHVLFLAQGKAKSYCL